MEKFVISASSQTGPVRISNEDIILVAGELVRNRVYHTEISIGKSSRFSIALADGLGGSNGGEVASRETLASLRFFVGDMPQGLTSVEFREVMNEWLESVNLMIASKGHVDPALLNMGTTMVALICYDGRFFVVNCGDSRLYRMRAGMLRQLTVDHSLDMLSGNPADANIVTNSIGGGADSSWLDISEITSDMRSGDIYMLCSDGLSNMLDAGQISNLLCSGTPDADLLCSAAISAGGYDNVSACVITII